MKTTKKTLEITTTPQEAELLNRIEKVYNAISFYQREVKTEENTKVLREIKKNKRHSKEIKKAKQKLKEMYKSLR